MFLVLAFYFLKQMLVDPKVHYVMESSKYASYCTVYVINSFANRSVVCSLIMRTMPVADATNVIL